MISVVVLTSSNQERDLVKSYKLGVNAYVVKPVDFHQFVNVVKELGVFWQFSMSRRHRVALKKT